MQYVGGVPAVIEHVAVAEPDRARKQLVAHVPAVDEPELLIGLCARRRRQADPTRQLDRTGGLIDGNEAREKILAQHLRHTLFALWLACRRRRIEQHTLAAAQAE